MKVKKEHYEMIVKAFSAQGMQGYYDKIESDLIVSARYKILEDAVMHRLIDIAWREMYNQHFCTWVCDNIYVYDCNDTHLLTALRHAIKEAGLKSNQKTKDELLSDYNKTLTVN